ncbi:hypothetical protein [Winogradskyella sp.]|uniref:hypothetical protein n=1 Tax=Winogradskyella sp. TaxID=1883156 RepID=UPI003AB52C72
MKNIIQLILISFIFFSFSTQTENLNKELLGIWIKKEFHQGVWVLKKMKRIKRKDQAYQFKNDGILFERWAAVLHGDKKAFYGNETSEWNISADSILTITKNYKSTIYKKNYKLLKISESELHLKMLGDEEIKK